MMHRIRAAYVNAESQRHGLMLVAEILQSRNPKLNLIAAICHADAIVYCLVENLDRCALTHLYEAMHYTGECDCHGAPDCCGSTN